jgi:hypothetical protein
MGLPPASDSSPFPLSAHRLLSTLMGLTPDERSVATNAELAGRIRFTDRTVTTALGHLQRAGSIRVRRTAPHPQGHTTGRHIDLWVDGEWR